MTCRHLALLALAVASAPASSRADDGAPAPVKRTPDATLGAIFGGPFTSSRLFAMPTADVVGAYVMTLSGDGSLLQETGVLTSAGVLAIGFGDIAQLEYRHSSAISITGVNAPLPSVGVQLEIPIPARPNVPAIGVAFRLGVPRRETFGETNVDETVTDLYAVARWQPAAIPWLTLHGGARISSARIELSGSRTFERDERIVLPTGGIELAVNPESKLVGEVGLAPQFAWMPDTDVDPQIGRGMIGRLGVRWAIVPSFILDGSLGYTHELGNTAAAVGANAIVQWDIRLGAEMFVPWGALACRATGVFCD